jgi:hypothetical protein
MRFADRVAGAEKAVLISRRQLARYARARSLEGRSPIMAGAEKEDTP